MRTKLLHLCQNQNRQGTVLARNPHPLTFRTGALATAAHCEGVVLAGMQGSLVGEQSRSVWTPWVRGWRVGAV